MALDSGLAALQRPGMTLYMTRISKSFCQVEFSISIVTSGSAPRSEARHCLSPEHKDACVLRSKRALSAPITLIIQGAFGRLDFVAPNHRIRECIWLSPCQSGRAYCDFEGRYKIQGRNPSIGMKLNSAHLFLFTSPGFQSEPDPGAKRLATKLRNA
jgi:hypothetical protein